MTDRTNILPNDGDGSTEHLATTSVRETTESRNGEEGGGTENGGTNNQGNTTPEQLPLQHKTVDKWKQTLSFLTPLFACLVLNIIVGLCYSTLLFVVSQVVRQAFDESAESVVKVQNTFRVFAALAAASCAPLMIRYGFRKVAVSGSVLLIFSCLSSSLTTTADILAIPFGFMGGVALGLLRTTGVVATLDYLHKRPLLALFISVLCFVIGQFIGFFVFALEIVLYVRSSRRWPNAMRIFEVIAVIGLLAGGFLQQNSHTQQNVSKVFKHPPFYVLLAINIAASVGMTILFPATTSLPQERGFQQYVHHPFLNVLLLILISQLLSLIVLLILRKFLKEHLKRTALMSSGILVLFLGSATLFHQLAFVNFWPLAAFGLILGVAQVFIRVMMPLALIQTTGKSNYKLVLPIFESVYDVGGLIGGSSMAKIVENTSSVNGALYYAGVSLIMSGAGAILGWVASKRWPPLEDETVAKPFLRGTANTYTTDEEIPGMDTNSATG